jgi:hypothetical protein|tara:strand:- start:42 stop:248 length:207 start_codon:yes stop_codon:yes gene_type:complete
MNINNKHKEFGMIDTEREARDYFHHNPKDKKIYFVMVMENEIERMEDEGIGYILETVENNNIQLIEVD